MDRKPQPSHEDLEPKPVIPSHDAEEMDDSELELEEDDLDLDDDVTDEEAERADGA
jgi:hypothetical protein